MTPKIIPSINKLSFTVFTDLLAKKINKKRASWDSICAVLRTPPEYPKKSSCPLIKLAKFGGTPTALGSLRSNDNMTHISGIEGDYDGEQVSIQDAHNRLQKGGITAFLYTSPSHTPSAPRWRVLCPLSRVYETSARKRFVDALNAALGGILASESFTPSQAFYFGRVIGAPYETAESVGTPIDLLAAKYPDKPESAAKSAIVGLPGPVPEHLHGVKLDDTTRSLIEVRPKSFARLLERSLAGTGCTQIRNLYEDQQNVKYDRWRSGLSIAVFCTDHETAIHEISRHYDKYTPEETIKKAADIAAPHTCKTFEIQRPDQCAGCPHKGKITSPIVLGIAVDDSATASASDNDAAVVARLAGLSRIQYDRVRAKEAKALGIRTSVLDALVDNARAVKQDNSNAPFVDVEPWDEPVDVAALLHEVSTTVRRYIVCEKEVSDAAALWVAMTWVKDALKIAPLAVVTAPEKRCGKSEFRRLLAKFVNRPLEADGMSSSVLFRGFDLWKPTLLIDEYDTFVKDDEDLRGIFNSGHQRGGCIWRCVGEDHEPRRFDVFGPKLLAGIGKLPGTMMDRAIIFELRRKLVHEKVDRLRYADDGTFDVLRQKLARFGKDYVEAVRAARPSMPDALNDRQQDNWEPLFATADIAGDDWPELARQAALKLSAEKEDSASMGAELLADIREIFTEKNVIRIFSFQLVHALCRDERRWCTHNRGGNITAAQVARILKGFSIVPKSMRIDIENAKGYEKEQFADAWRRYLPSTL
jgi:hypothetical protein